MPSQQTQILRCPSAVSTAPVHCTHRGLTAIQYRDAYLVCVGAPEEAEPEEGARVAARVAYDFLDIADT